MKHMTSHSPILELLLGVFEMNCFEGDFSYSSQPHNITESPPILLPCLAKMTNHIHILYKGVDFMNVIVQHLVRNHL